jgi:hypothetical protein
MGMKRAVAAGLIALGVVVAAPVAGAASREVTRQPGPDRVLLVGDSITVNYQDVAAAELGARGYQVIRAGIVGASLLDADICGGAYAKDLLKMVDPDVVVFENNGNYAARRGVAVCRPTVYGSDVWLRRWRNAAALNQRILKRRGARFIWVQAPSVKMEPKAAVVPKLNSIYEKLGDTADAWTEFGGETFDPSLRYDGQHLNESGAELMTDVVVDAVTDPATP